MRTNFIKVILLSKLLAFSVSAIENIENPGENFLPVRILSIAALDNQASEIDANVSFDILLVEIENLRTRLLKERLNQG